MARTIKTSINGPFTLSATDNPLLITTAGTITSTGGDGIDGDVSAAWTITNRGDILAYGIGVALAGAGSVTNSGLIATGGRGVFIGGAGKVQNSGTILAQGGRGAVDIVGNGTVTNAAGAAITGGGYGVYLDTSGLVTNSGSISGALGGVAIVGTGSVINRAGGVISSNTVATEGALLTVGVNLGSGTITNNGTISGQVGAAVVFSGAVTNTLGAAIQGSGAGVVMDGSAAVVSNAGIISGQKDFGIFLGSSGTVTNLAGGSISGGADGVHGFGATTITNSAGGTISSESTASYSGSGIWIDSGSVRNAGAIKGHFNGVYINRSGSVTNSTGGSISGAGYGISIGRGTGAHNSIATVSNSGSISGGLGGVYIDGSGAVTNNAAGMISNGVAFFWAVNAAVTNAGTITGKPTVAASFVPGVFVYGASGMVTNIGTGTIANGIYLGADGTVTNTQNALISGGIAISLDYSSTMNDTGSGTIGNAGTILGGIGLRAGTVANKGSIAGGITFGRYYVFAPGRELVGPGTVTNSGAISGGIVFNGSGYKGSGTSGTVTNSGSISVGSGAAVLLSEAGTVTNARSGTIAAAGSQGYGVELQAYRAGGTFAITNAGTISGAEGGVGWLTRPFTGTDGATPTTITNSGLIAGGLFGVRIDGTVTNSGTISGGMRSVYMNSSWHPTRLIIDPGAVFVGVVQNVGSGTIELAAGTGAVGGIGGQYIGFTTLQVDQGAHWTLNGVNTIGTVLNQGTIGLAGSLTVGTSIDPTSTGMFQLAASSVLEVAAATGVSSKMSFASGSELIVDQFASFGQNVGSLSYAGPLLEHFGAGTTVDLKDFSYGTGGFTSTLTASGILELTNSASQQADLAFQKSSLGSGTFHFAQDAGAGVLVTRG